MTAIPRASHPDHQQTEQEPRTERNDYSMWRSYCTDLIFAAATCPLAYARAVSSRARWGRSPEVRAWFAACARLPKESKDEHRDRVAERISDLIATWKTWGGGKRKIGLALLNGEVLGQRLRDAFPECRTIMHLANEATGEYLPETARSDRWHATVSENVALLPPVPPAVLERWQARSRAAGLVVAAISPEAGLRASKTEESRQAAATAIADDLWNSRRDL